MKLDPDFKATWLKALRSNRYQQTKGTLRQKFEKGYGYCCLGVACNLVGNGKGWHVADNSSGYGAKRFGWGDLSNDATMGFPFIDSALTVEVNPNCLTDHHSGRYSDRPVKVNALSTLIDLNDDGRPFTEIADFIDKYL